MTQETEDVVGGWAAKAKAARRTECALEYQAYWRGYAEAFEEAAQELAAHGQPLSDRLAVQDDLLRRAQRLIRPYCAADEELRAFSDELTVCLVEEKE